MNSISINEEVIDFPEGWNEVTLRQFIDITILKQDDTQTNIEQFANLLCLLSKNRKVKDFIFQLSIEDFHILQSMFTWVAVDPTNMSPTQDNFKIGDEVWTLKKEFSKLNVGEMVTIEQMLKDKKTFNLNPIEIAFGTLFRRIKDGKTVAFNTDDLFKIIGEHSNTVMVSEVIPVINFFLSGDIHSSTPSSKVCLVKKEQKTKSSTLKSTQKKQKKSNKASADGAGSDL